MLKMHKWGILHKNVLCGGIFFVKIIEACENVEQFFHQISQIYLKTLPDDMFAGRPLMPKFVRFSKWAPATDAKSSHVQHKRNNIWYWTINFKKQSVRVWSFPSDVCNKNRKNHTILSYLAHTYFTYDKNRNGKWKYNQKSLHDLKRSVCSIAKSDVWDKNILNGCGHFFTNKIWNTIINAQLWW